MTREKSVLAWHFLRDDGTLRDGRKAPRVGVWLRHTGPAVMCQSGLHASLRAMDALKYAPGSLVCRVECRIIVDRHDDKFLCLERRILWKLDATKVLREFARKEALDVSHLWDAPDVMMRFLRTGDDSLRAAARDAAAAARAAAAAARDAAWAATWDAAAAAWAAAAAAWAAAGAAAAWDAARAKQERRLVAMLNAARSK